MRVFILTCCLIARAGLAQNSTLSPAALEHYQNGVVYWISGQSDSARFALETALRLAPDYYEPHVALGDLFLREGAYERARKNYSRAQSLRPEAAAPHLGLGHVMWEADANYPGALVEYRAALNLESGNAEANYFVGQALLYDDQLAEAMSYFEQAHQHAPSHAGSHAKLALIHMLRGDTARAARHWREFKRKGGLSQALVEFSQNLILTVAENGIIFTNGEEDTYPLWYLQLSEGLCRDVCVVNAGLLNFTWYVRMLRAHAGLDVRYKDEELQERLQERAWPKPKPETIAGLRWIIPPAPGQKSLRAQDVVTLDVLAWNAWLRPIYFAVTLAPENKLGLEDFLSLEGLAFRLHPKKTAAVQVDSTWANARKRYSYTHSAAPSDATARALTANYATMFCLLADAYLQRRDREQCHATLALADKLDLLQDTRANEWAARLASSIASEELAARFKRKAEALKRKQATIF